MTPALEVRPPSPGITRRMRSSRLAGNALAVVIGAAAVAGLDAFVFDDPTFVDRVSFDNSSGYDIHVTVTGEHSGSLPLGVAKQRCVTTFELVIDQGDVWRITFRAQGQDGGDLDADRDALEADKWRYRIPDSVTAQLEAAGAPLPPRQQCDPAR